MRIVELSCAFSKCEDREMSADHENFVIALLDFDQWLDLINHSCKCALEFDDRFNPAECVALNSN